MCPFLPPEPSHHWYGRRSTLSADKRTGLSPDFFLSRCHASLFPSQTSNHRSDLRSAPVGANRVPPGLNTPRFHTVAATAAFIWGLWALPPTPQGKSDLLQINLHSLPFPCGDAFNYLLRKYYRRHFTG